MGSRRIWYWNYLQKLVRTIYPIYKGVNKDYLFLKTMILTIQALDLKYKENILPSFKYSASPTKLFSTIEGSFINTDNYELAETLRRSRNYGKYPDYTCELPGLNARLSENNAEIYMRELSKIPDLSFQKVDSRDLSTYKDFSIIIDFEKFG